MGTMSRGWLLAVGAVAVSAFFACSDDSTPATSPQVDAGSNDGSSGGPEASVDSSTPAATTYKVVLLHTNDLHGHLEGHAPELDYTPLVPNNDSTVGGFARLASRVAAERTAAAGAGKSVILADAGDFMMGTAFSSFLGVSEATELYEMAALGYDAITLGNHEFDFTSLALAGSFQRSVLRGKLPPLVATNMTVPTGIPFRQLIDGGLIPTKKILTLPNGLRVGFIGIMGKNAADVAPLAAPVTFAPPVTSGVVAPIIQTTVDALRNTDKVDVVIALSHSGTDEKGQGEDNVLAQKSHGIDIIVSGHTHVALATPVAVPNAGGGTTYVVQTGAYGLKLGKMDFTFKRGAGLTMDAYALQAIDDTVAGDATVQTRIDGYVSEIDQIFTAASSPLRYFGPVAATGFDLPNTPFQETALGDLVTDAYLTAANAAPGAPPSDLAVEASGNIRESLLKGKTGALAFADVFNVAPLGIGPDQQPGYPLTAVYLNAKDIVSGLSLSAAAADPASAALGLRDNDFFLQLSGATYRYDLKQGATPLQHVTHVEVGGNVIFDTTTKPIPDTATCYRVVTTYYVASLLGLLQTATGGALSATPKQADCTTVYTSATLPQAIIDGCPICAGPTQHEIKQWKALVGFIAASPPVMSVPTLPAGYATPKGRIVAAP
jgi:5'-nucleotidase / UDP-sugar diphosphatase